MYAVIEGVPDNVIDVILGCHCRVHDLVPDVLTRITLDDQRGVTGTFTTRSRDDEEILGKPPSGADTIRELPKERSGRRSWAAP